MTRAPALIVPAIVMALGGCVCVTVTKLPPNSDAATIKGQRFSLPRPFIQATPKEDGSISAEIIYLPDPERTYAVKSFSVLANDTLEVATEGEIVKTLNWTGISAAVVEQAAASAGTIASGILQAERTKKADQKEKEDTASKAVDDAKLELEQAQTQLAILLADPGASQESIRQARIAVANAALKLRAAQAAVDRLRGRTMPSLELQQKTNEADEAVRAAQSELEQAQQRLAAGRRKGAAPADIQEAKRAVENANRQLLVAKENRNKLIGLVFGPKLFAIREEIRMTADRSSTTPYLEVKTVEQKRNPSEMEWNPLQPMYPVKWPDPPKPPQVRIFPEGVKSVSKDDKGNRRLTLQSSAPLFEYVQEKTCLVRGFVETPPANSADCMPLPPIALDSPTVFDLDLESLDVGDYTLILAYRTRKPSNTNGEAEKIPVKFRIVS